MKKTLTLALGLAGALSLSACQTPQQQTGTLAGGAIGAGGGRADRIGAYPRQRGRRHRWGLARRRDRRFNRQRRDRATASGRCAQFGYDYNGNRVCTAFY